MIYTFDEYKVKIREAERLEFAKRYAVTTDPKGILSKHNILCEVLENDEYVREMYEVYLKMKGIK